MSYRKFKLINNKGQVWEFTNRQVKSFLSSPSQLGFSNTIKVDRYINSANVISQEYAFPNPSGEVIFYDSKNADRYQKYYDLCRFLAETPLKLVYTLPFDTPEDYELDCYVTNLTKTESTTDKTLTCQINFQGLSFWKGTTKTITDSTTSYTLTNEGDDPVGFEITIEGSMTNPYFTLTQDGEIYGQAKFENDVQFDKVYVNSNDGKQSIELEQSGTPLPNPQAYQDYSISNGAIYVTFIKIAKGTSTLDIGVESGSISNVNIEYTPIYRSV